MQEMSADAMYQPPNSDNDKFLSEVNAMKITRISWVSISCLLAIVGFALGSAGSAHSHMFRTPRAQEAGASAGPSDTQKANLEAYVTLLHENVADQKEQVVALVLFLNEADAAKFWPIYNQYEAELGKLNATAAASIDDYVKNAGHLSEQQADEVVHSQTQFQNQRGALLDRYYGQVKDALGPETAARFYEAESQLLSLSDLQRSSKLPVE
jgi:hypothetical protein